jgi:TrmH family RNA methyltransferase
MMTLAWFGGFRLLLSSASLEPYNPKVVRASMGAIFHIDIELDVVLDDLQKRFERFAYLDMQGSQIKCPDFGQYECYLFGNEARGVPAKALQDFNARAFTIISIFRINPLNLTSALSTCAEEIHSVT